MYTYQICKRCIMDSTDKDIRFDEKGICNHCHHYDQRASKELFYNDEGQRRLEKIVEVIKKRGKKREYDCLIGLSGGIDSTMVAYTAKKLNLRPLAVHLDNGWDSELAISNIEKTVKELKIDLLTHIIDWEEFRDLQLSFLKASVINSEIPTDHAITALLYKTAYRMGIPYILGGGNIVTEAIMPPSWGYDSRDWKHIKGIHRRFGSVKLRSYPRITAVEFAYYLFFKKIKYVPVLNYVPYVKKEAAQLLEKEIGWRNYGLKHCESIFTRFFQNHILPLKFGIDKRKAHLSTLICSHQMTRQEALKELENEIYPSDKLQEDRDYVLKKLGLTSEEFDRIMSQPAKKNIDYPTNILLSREMPLLISFIKKTAKL